MEPPTDVPDSDNQTRDWPFEHQGFFFRQLQPGLKLDNPVPEAFSKASPAERTEIQRQMDSLLARPRTREEMFPDANLTYSQGRHFYQVHSDEIATLFPAADADLRALLLRFSQLFVFSYFWKIVLKRIWFALSIPVFYFSTHAAKALLASRIDFTHLESSLTETIVLYSATGVSVFLLVLLVSGILDERFTRALQTSCTVISQNGLQRLSALTSCLDNVQIAIRDLYDRTGDTWVTESRYLMGLMIWLPLRVLHLESYFQLTMWKVRREFTYVQYLAIILQLAIVGLTVLVVFKMGPAAFIGGTVGARAFAVTVAAIAVLSFLGASTSVQFVRQNIPIDQWATFGAIRVDNAIAGVVGFLIKKFIMLRDVGRPS